MVKYRCLTSLELEALQDEFVKFLVLNGVSAQDWLNIREHQPAITNGFIDAFSDVVFEGIVRKVTFLEFVDKSGLKVFKCDDAEITLIGLDNVSQDMIDFSNFIALIDRIKAQPNSFKIYKTSKKYYPERNTEIFKMISNGAMTADQTWFETLESLYHSE